MTDPWDSALAGFREMTEAIRRDQRDRELIRAMTQQNTPQAPVDPGDELRQWMQEQRDAIARRLGLK